MPPTFTEDSFKFEEGQTVPDHFEGYPDTEVRNRTKIWLQGEDTFDNEYYPLAIDIDDMPTAEVLRVARLRKLEEEQPTESSGGQSWGGIQDRVYIRQPNA